MLMHADIHIHAFALLRPAPSVRKSDRACQKVELIRLYMFLYTQAPCWEILTRKERDAKHAELHLLPLHKVPEIIISSLSFAIPLKHTHANARRHPHPRLCTVAACTQSKKKRPCQPEGGINPIIYVFTPICFFTPRLLAVFIADQEGSV